MPFTNNGNSAWRKIWETETKGGSYFFYLFKSTGKERSFLIPIVMCIFCLFLNEDLVSCLFITRVFQFGFALFVFQMCEVVFFPQLPGAQRSLGSVGED